MSEPTPNRRLRELHAHRFDLMVGALAVVCSFGSAVSAHPGDNPPILPFYHPDPQHLWNRLHDAIFVRNSNLRTCDSWRPALLAGASLAEVNTSAVEWKQSRPNWTALRRLLAE